MAIKRFTDATVENDIIYTAGCLYKGGMSPEGVKQVLELATQNINSGFPIKDKIEDVVSGLQHKTKPIAEEIREYVEATIGNIKVTDAYNHLHLTTRADKKSAQMALKRLSDTGELEKKGVGLYKKIDKTVEIIDYKNATNEKFPIILPFGLNQLVDIYPRNIIVFAGEQNSGKTTISLNVADMNEKFIPVDYLSSEMAEQELKLRLGKFPDKELNNWKTRFIDRSDNFEDLIDGSKKLWIVDYLELVENFYEIAGILKKMYQKLRKGIVIVCIQKDPNKAVGRGGNLGLDKPRLYLNISYGSIEIIKAKNFASSTFNPNGRTNEFKIIDGAILWETKTFKED